MKETIMQFGEGVFLRGFFDYFLSEMNRQGLYDGKAVVVQPRSGGRVHLLNEQKGMYNLYMRGIENGEVKELHTVVDSISRGIDPYTDFDEYMSLADNPELRFIVSNTTEAGIAYDSGCLFSDTPALSFPGKLTQLLFRRYKNRLPGFILLPCELIDKNGEKLKSCVLNYSDQWDLGKDFEAWLENENVFSNTLVDRIVTGYPAEEAQSLAPEDKLLNTSELYHLWVIEGEYEAELPLKAAGFNVIWTDDVSVYKKRKVRILNGAHTSMVACAILCGLTSVGECMQDCDVSAYISKCLFDEILPTIGDSADNTAFAKSVLDRFRNPFIRHLLRSIAMNSVSKFSVRVLPTSLEYKENHGSYPKGLTMALAMLIYFYKNDSPDDAESVRDFIKASDVCEILKSTLLWGTDISDMTEIVSEYLDKIQELGARGAVKWLLSE